MNGARTRHLGSGSGDLRESVHRHGIPPRIRKASLYGDLARQDDTRGCVKTLATSHPILALLVTLKEDFTPKNFGFPNIAAASAPGSFAALDRLVRTDEVVGRTTDGSHAHGRQIGLPFPTQNTIVPNLPVPSQPCRRLAWPDRRSAREAGRLRIQVSTDMS